MESPKKGTRPSHKVSALNKRSVAARITTTHTSEKRPHTGLQGIQVTTSSLCPEPKPPETMSTNVLRNTAN